MKPLFIATLISLLSACASSPDTQYFTLPNSHFILPTHTGEERSVRVILAEPLKQNGLLYQTDKLHLNFARHHVWANPLEQALASRFANELNQHNPRYRYIPAHLSQQTATLTIYIQAFQGSYQGKTLVQGYSRLPNGMGKNFLIETPQHGDGYTAMVESLSHGISQASQYLMY